MVWNLHALRGLACLAVVCYHLALVAPYLGIDNSVFDAARRFGFAGVDVFFVLSGFIIAYTTAASAGRPGSVPGYLFRRFWRVYPSYWAAMALAALVGVGLMSSPYLGREHAGEWGEWLSLVPGGAPNLIVPPAWSLLYEVVFYVMFGAVLAIPRRGGNFALMVWAASALAACVLEPLLGSTLSAVVSPFALEFLGGVLAAKMIRSGITGGGRIAHIAAVVHFAAALALVASSSWSYDDFIAQPSRRVLLFGPSSIFLVYGLASAEFRGGVRPWKWLIALGDVSYSLYLTHSMVLVTLLWVWVAFTGGTAPRIPWLAGMLAACIGFGFLFHHAVERPLLNLTRRKKTPAVALLTIPFELKKAA